MDESTWLNAALSFGGVLSGAFVSWYFFREGQKTDFRRLEDKLGSLGSGIENLRNQLPELLRSGWSSARQSIEENKSSELRVGLVGKIMTYFESLVESAQKSLLSEKKRADIYNFKKGWVILFDDLFGGEEHGPRILRDFTISRLGKISFGGYDFPGYVEILRERLIEARKVRSVDVDLRVLMICDSSEESESGNVAVEKYLDGFLDLKFPTLEKESGTRKLREWSRGKNSGSGIEIRLIGKSSVESARRRENLTKTPFNVYGNKAVSRSIVETNRGYTEPHLEILLNSRDIDDYTKAFDELWDAAEDFQKEIFVRLGDQDMEGLGTGVLIKRWSSLGVTS